MIRTKNEKLSELERKMREMERRVNYSLGRMDETITTLNEIIFRLQKENNSLRSEKDFLIERHKKMLKRIPVPNLTDDIREHLVKPTADVVRENVELVRMITKEGFVEIKPEKKKRMYRKDPAKTLKEHVLDGARVSDGKSIDRLFEMVNRLGTVKSDEAARKMNVHEIQIEEWGKILEQQELVTVRKSSMGRIEITKT